jgi:hypothetical protein
MTNFANILLNYGLVPFTPPPTLPISFHCGLVVIETISIFMRELFAWLRRLLLLFACAEVMDNDDVDLVARTTMNTTN